MHKSELGRHLGLLYKLRSHLYSFDKFYLGSSDAFELMLCHSIFVAKICELFLNLELT